MTDKTGAAAAPRTDAGTQLADEASALWWQPNHLAGANAMESATRRVRAAILAIENEASAMGAEKAARAIAGAAESGASRRNAIDEIARLGQQIENAESGASPLRGDIICKCGLAKSYHPRLVTDGHEYEPRYAEDRGLAALPRYGMTYDRNYMQVIGLVDDGPFLLRDSVLAALPHGEPAQTPQGRDDHGDRTGPINPDAMDFPMREPARTAGDPRVAALEAAIREAMPWAEVGCNEARAAGRHDRECPVDRLRALLHPAALSEASSVREPGGEGDHE